MPLDTVRYVNKTVRLINQRKLPDSFEYFTATTVEDVAYAIKNMIVRGAPAIGITAAYGMKLFAETYEGENFEEDALKAIELLRRTRPTGKNLFRALEHIKKAVDKGPEAVSKAADEVVNREIEFEKTIADHSLKFVEMISEKLGLGKEITFHTHCNAGRLATYGLFGTATAPIYVAHRNGYNVHAIADETRPVLQGARLTARELSVAGVDTMVISDTAIGFVLMKGLSDVVVVGADRVCKDRTIVNKIGTYVLATMARRHNVPVVVVAPTSTFDDCTFDNPPPIEERDEREVRFIRDVKIVPDGARVLNYAFDITPPELVNYVISEKGIHEVNPI